ncbi:hypothetical protein Aduo_012043 [Ancylostoma duodenale]
MTSDEIATLFEVVRDLIPHFETQKFFASVIFAEYQSVGRKPKEYFPEEDAADGKAIFREVLDKAFPMELERACSAFMTWLESKNEAFLSIVSCA